jgi:hypothetical protein
MARHPGAVSYGEDPEVSRRIEAPPQEKPGTRIVGEETQYRIRQLADRDGSRHPPPELRQLEAVGKCA